MGVDTKIYLNNHATVEKVLDVMAVVLGADLIINDERDTCDITAPCGPKNSWRAKVNHNPKDSISYTAPTYFEVVVNDIAGNQFNTLFFYDVDDSEYAQNGERLLNPRSSGAWISIGKKLVDFFGGKLMYADCEDFNDPENWYVVKKGLYESKIKHCDDRWYGYHNAIKNIKPLTSEDVLESRSKCAYWGEREESMVNHFNKFRQFNDLTKELDETEKPKSTKKMKV